MWWDSHSKACQHSRSSFHSWLMLSAHTILEPTRTYAYVCVYEQTRARRLDLHSRDRSFMLKLSPLSEGTAHLGPVSPSVESSLPPSNM